MDIHVGSREALSVDQRRRHAAHIAGLEGLRDFDDLALERILL